MTYQNEFTDLIQACKYFYITLKNNESLSINLIINGITLNVNLYKLPPNTIVYNNDQVKSIFSLCNTDDCATQIILVRSLTIETGVTFTPPYRCKGIIIYDAQNLINNGTISMSARGAHATGQNIWLYNNEYVPAVGADGAPSVSGWSGDPNTWIQGGNGYNGTGRQTGGGGGGLAGGAWTWGGVWFSTGRGGNGTSFSGGTGAGQWRRHSSGYGGPMLDPNGTDDGGHGGHGSQNWDYAYSDYGCPGGVGNPSGRHTRWTRGGFTRELNASTDHNQASGTGGLLIIFAFNLQNNGSIDANGVASLHDGAGSSGGGSINIFYSKQFIRGSINAIGGQGGRYGGDGTISVDIIPSSYFTPHYFKRLNSDIYKDSTQQAVGELTELLMFSEKDTSGSDSSVTSEKVPGNSLIDRWLRFDPKNKRGVIIKTGTNIKLPNGSIKSYITDTHIDLTSYITQGGADYYLYIDNNGDISAYTDYQSTGNKIGRLHTLCVDVGANVTMIAPAPASCGYTTNTDYLIKSYRQEKDPDFYAFYNKKVKSVIVQSQYDVVTVDHPLSGFQAGDILPESVFCLNWYPDTLFEDGMVYDKDTNRVIDIYLQSGTGHNTRSKYNQTHTINRQPYNHAEDMRMVGKRLLYDNEFTSAAIGSNEKTSIARAADASTIGGHKDTNNRRMISAIGCEEMCGYLWQWLQETSSVGGSGWVTTDQNASFGQEYGDPYVLYAGGSWDNGASCGSRSRVSVAHRSYVSDGAGGRGSGRILTK